MFPVPMFFPIIMPSGNIRHTETIERTKKTGGISTAPMLCEVLQNNYSQWNEDGTPSCCDEDEKPIVSRGIVLGVTTEGISILLENGHIGTFDSDNVKVLMKRPKEKKKE